MGFSAPATKTIEIPEPGRTTQPQPVRKPAEAPKPELVPAERELAPTRRAA
jgi:hypothetical protein